VLALTVDIHTKHTAALLKAVAAAEGDLAAQGGVHQRHTGCIEGVGAEGIRRLGAIEAERAVRGTLAEIGEAAGAVHQVIDAAEHPMNGHGLLRILRIFDQEVTGAHGCPLQRPAIGSSRQIKDEEITENDVNFLVVWGQEQIVVTGDVLAAGRIGREELGIAVIAGVCGLDREGLGRYRRRGGEANDT